MKTKEDFSSTLKIKIEGPQNHVDEMDQTVAINKIREQFNHEKSRIECKSNSSDSDKNIVAVIKEEREEEDNHKHSSNEVKSIEIKYEAYSVCPHCNERFLCEEKLTEHYEKCPHVNNNAKIETSHHKPDTQLPLLLSSQDQCSSTSASPSLSMLTSKSNIFVVVGDAINSTIETDEQEEEEEEYGLEVDEDETEMEFDLDGGNESNHADSDPLLETTGAGTGSDEIDQVISLIPYNDCYTPKIVNDNKMLCFVENCDQAFRWKWKLYKHLMKHVQNYPKENQVFKCLACPKEYPTLNRLKNHMIIHVTENKFQCSAFPPCQRNFHNRNALEKHERVHVKKNRTCQICSRKFTTAYLKKHHMKTHEKYNENQDNEGPSKMQTKTRQNKLRSKKVKEESIPTTTSNSNNNEDVKVKVETQTDMILQVEESEQKHKQQGNFQCIICRKSYVFFSGLRKHNITEHGLAIV